MTHIFRSLLESTHPPRMSSWSAYNVRYDDLILDVPPHNVGDLLLTVGVCGSEFDSYTFDAPPSGWTANYSAATTSSGYNAGWLIATRTAGGSEPSNYTFTNSPGGALNTAGAMLVCPMSAYDSHGTPANDGASTSQIVPGGFTSAGGILIGAFVRDPLTSGGFATCPALGTPLIELLQDTYEEFNLSVYAQPTTAGATGSRTASNGSSNSHYGSGILLGIKSL